LFRHRNFFAIRDSLEASSVSAVTIRQRCGKISRGLWHNGRDSCNALAMVETFLAIRDLPAAAAGGMCPGWSHGLATRFG
jgi:hypothetical protein